MILSFIAGGLIGWGIGRFYTIDADSSLDATLRNIQKYDDLLRKITVLREDAQEIGKLQMEINDKLAELISLSKIDTTSKDIIDVE